MLKNLRTIFIFLSFMSFFYYFNYKKHGTESIGLFYMGIITLVLIIIIQILIFMNKKKS